MRWVRKVNGTAPWPMTDALASRKDMMEISEDEAHSLLRLDVGRSVANPEPVFDPQLEAETPATGEALTADAVRAMTDKDALVEFAEGFGIVVDRRRSVKTMQDDLIQALGLPS